ncbi:asparagine synthase-like protein [Schizothecium vesticola]|uniref:Asparagine synthase-like protein n=1 Tax=Schizothecium vesticola TaxID=314040 RepID=A0AA40K2U3_9PEZI|nr:asparagine synthase-like protein [Schizothecium vesticola]
MCGIHVSLSSAPRDIPEAVKTCLRNRGPDFLGQTVCSNDASLAHCLTFSSTVLALRGDHLARQPLVSPDGRTILCWNGEAWRLDGHRIEGNDGEAIHDLLTKASASDASSRQDAILNVLRAIEGPFAFVYYDKSMEKLFFGRDRLGRRSLMLAQDGISGDLVISSIAEACDLRWKEVEADRIYVVDLGPGSPVSAALLRQPVKHEWLAEEHIDFVSSIGRFNKALPSDNSALASTSPSVAMLKDRLLDSLRLRVLHIPPPPLASPTSVRLAILFSGGLDCTVLARLTHDLLEAEAEIDLINVAFENPRVVARLKKEANGEPVDFYEACPDRITGRKSFAELEAVCPGRAFRFLAVNVPFTDTVAHRRQVISLIYPHNTEMDLSIAYALYFAARARGVAVGTDGLMGAPYESPVRVLLSGLGADELFGGYRRHSVAFSRKGYPGLVDELLLDVSQLSTRNLGRDDRVMAHCGKEVRFPYLDECLVKWAMETPAWEKCDFENGEDANGIEAGKRVLRLLALELGMRGVAQEKKRAIQFGARTARMECGRVKGTTLLS